MGEQKTPDEGTPEEPGRRPRATTEPDIVVPTDPPEQCPVCGHRYESVTRHRSGLMVALRENARYERVCLHPVSVDGEARLDFYHHARD